MTSLACINAGPKRTLFYTPTDGGIKDARKRGNENSKYDVTQGHERGKRTMTSLACIFDGPAQPLVYTPRVREERGTGKDQRETQNMTSHKVTNAETHNDVTGMHICWDCADAILLKI